MNNQDLLSVDDVASLLDLTPRTIRNWARASASIKGFNNNFPKPVKIIRRLYWIRNSIDSWIHSCQIK